MGLQFKVKNQTFLRNFKSVDKMKELTNHIEFPLEEALEQS
ncbi:hypothetical protein C5167_005543 [Papaver somniferum]|uniref:Uncharacterized protein n=1 Tax=Papaver somniferum TaxID=3469 RepID=A0A4Y7JBR3_PAPSO|nr:hypothetical protein C5167_005543 [Papaver somniferum]